MILSRGGIFGKYMGSVPMQHHEELGQLLIYGSNSDLESEKELRDWLADHMSPLNSQMIFHLCLWTNGHEATSWFSNPGF